MILNQCPLNQSMWKAPWWPAVATTAKKCKTNFKPFNLILSKDFYFSYCNLTRCSIRIFALKPLFVGWNRLEHKDGNFWKTLPAASGYFWPKLVFSIWHWILWKLIQTPYKFSCSQNCPENPLFQSRSPFSTFLYLLNFFCFGLKFELSKECERKA